MSSYQCALGILQSPMIFGALIAHKEFEPTPLPLATRIAEGSYTILQMLTFNMIAMYIVGMFSFLLIRLPRVVGGVIRLLPKLYILLGILSGAIGGYPLGKCA